MISVVLMILKIIGIVILCILGILLLLLMLVLFVPVKYQVTARKKDEEEIPVILKVKVTWLLHIINVAFSYPEAAYIRIRVFLFTVFDSSKQDKTSEEEDPEISGKPALKKQKKVPETSEKTDQNTISAQAMPEEADGKEKAAAPLEGNGPGQHKDKNIERRRIKSRRKIPRLIRILKKIWHAIKNIRYTILKICDKIKNIVNNVNYYLDILRSESFQAAWKSCSGEALSLLKSIRPRKLRGEILFGTGDPADTAQIFGIYGILYPFIGNHIFVTPDLDNPVLEGEFYMKGHVTVFKVVKTGIKIYFNKNLRKVIRMFKREAA